MQGIAVDTSESKKRKSDFWKIKTIKAKIILHVVLEVLYIGKYFELEELKTNSKQQ